MLKEQNKHLAKSRLTVRSIQQALPKMKIYASGMMSLGHLYSMTYRLKDVDFITSTEEDQEAFFKQYENLLNSMDGRTATFKLTMFNRNSNYLKTDYILLPTDRGDGYDQLRHEYNSMRRNNRAKAEGLIQEKFLTITTEKENSSLAEDFFKRIGDDFTDRLKGMRSELQQMNIHDRMELFYDFYRNGMEGYFSFDYEAAKERMTSWRDYVCPNELQFKASYIRLHGRYARVLFLRDWGKALPVDTLTELMSLKTTMMLSVDIIPFAPGSAAKVLDDSEMAAESNLDRWQRRSGAERHWFSKPPLRIQRDQQIVSTYSDDVENRNQKLFLANIYMVVVADTLQEIQNFTETLAETAGDCGGAEIQVLEFRQLKGLNTVLPYGPRFTQNLRNVTTENLAAVMPFNNIQINHITGVPYGVIEETKQEVLIDRRLLMNGNEWVLGTSGSGKSMRVKITAIMEWLLTPGDIIFVDPHGEYAHVTRALGGQVITLGSKSSDVINAMDMCQGYGDGDDLKSKMELLVGIFHAALGHEFTKPMEAIVMRCSQRVYYNYLSRQYAGDPPTLQTLYEEVKMQPEPVAQHLALLIEPMLIGPMSCFNGLSNVDIFSRVTCFDISKMDRSVWDAGMTVVMDAIQNRLVVNHSSGTPTYIKIDEVGRFLYDPYLTRLFERFYSECRKFGGYITGIIQNVNKLLRLDAARNMLSNSEIVVMFCQSQSDMEDLCGIYKMSDSQRNRLISVEGGCGVLKCGTQFINFDGRIEKGYIYQLADTKPDHDFWVMK
ncbi:MAG: DUF87 domain-containing protein [Eubacterium sp.]|nr:DUF87 domain-containing protein [Eubacterium sp.]